MKSSKNTVRTGVFVGHAVRYLLNSLVPPKKYGPNGSVRWTKRSLDTGGGGSTVPMGHGHPVDAHIR